MTENQTPTPEDTTPSQQPGTQNTTTNQRRRPGTTNRNSNLASMANAERGFSGKVETLPVIGKQYEAGVNYEKFIDDVVDHTILNLEEGDDMVTLLEKQIDDFDLATGLSEPTISDEDAEKKGLMFVFSRKHDV